METYTPDYVELYDDPPVPDPDYRCWICGAPIDAATADAQNSMCDECAGFE